MRAFDSAENTRPSCSLFAHTSDVGTGRMENKDYVKVSVDLVNKALNGKKTSVTSFDTQKCSRREI